MAERDASMGAAIRTSLAGRRRELKTPPSPDELIAYHEGRLTPAEREQVEAGLAAFPEAARALLDMASFPEIEPLDPQDRLTDEEAARGWAELRERLREDGLLGPAEPGQVPRKVAEGDRGQRGSREVPRRPARGRWKLVQALAAAVLVVGVGLPAFLALRPGPEPKPNVPLVSLLPLTVSGQRGGGDAGETVAVDDARDGVMLQLNLAEPETFPAYRLEIVSAARGSVWTTEALRRQGDGTFTTFVPQGFLAAGRYRLELSGVAAGSERHLATYVLILEP